MSDVTVGSGSGVGLSEVPFPDLVSEMIRRLGDAPDRAHRVRQAVVDQHHDASRVALVPGRRAF